VTFDEVDADRMLLALRERYPSEEVLDQAIVGMEDAMPEQFEQLDEILSTLLARG